MAVEMAPRWRPISRRDGAEMAVEMAARWRREVPSCTAPRCTRARVHCGAGITSMSQSMAALAAASQAPVLTFDKDINE